MWETWGRTSTRGGPGGPPHLLWGGPRTRRRRGLGAAPKGERSEPEGPRGGPEGGAQRARGAAHRPRRGSAASPRGQAADPKGERSEPEGPPGGPEGGAQRARGAAGRRRDCTARANPERRAKRRSGLARDVLSRRRHDRPHRVPGWPKPPYARDDNRSSVALGRAGKKQTLPENARTAQRNRTGGLSALAIPGGLGQPGVRGGDLD